MNSVEFRKELVKIMPGYEWTVHKSRNPEIYMEATGIQSSGFNRLSTLRITRRVTKEVPVWYEAKSAGFGLRSSWLAERGGRTLAQALRALQSHYEHMTQTYRRHASYLQNARKAVQ